MNREQKPRSGMALGGVGAGSFEIRHDGTTQNWTIFNNKPLGLGPHFTFPAHSMLFFIVKWRFDGEEPRMKLLQIEESHGAASLERHEIQYIFPWLTGVDEIKYTASFPFARLYMQAKDMPFDAEIEAWSPFIPFDKKNSSLPGAFFDIKIKSKTKKKLHITLAASLRNAVGYDFPDRYYISELCSYNNTRGFMHGAGNIPENHPSNGSMGILSLSPKSKCYLGWEHPHPYYEKFLIEDEFPEINDIEGRNKVDNDTGKKKIYCDRCWSTIATQKTLNKSEVFKHCFILTWHFPNNYARSVTDKKGEYRMAEHIEGHFYSNFFNNSFDVAKYFCENRKKLEEKSRAFHKAFYSSSAPEFVLDQVNSHLNTFFTSSWFTKDGNFGIIEGLSPTDSYAGLSTIDVAMYEGISYASLFPDLSHNVNSAYMKFQKSDGSVAHSIHCNFREIPETETNTPRLDLPAQYAFMILRDALWANNPDEINKVYNSAKNAIEYVLKKRDKNKDGLPDMEGIMCSYDNFPMYGISSFVAGQFIVALKLLSIAAKKIAKIDDEKKYSELFSNGVKIFEEKLWNGKYFRLCHDQGSEKEVIDEGCLSDQLISQWAAHQIALGHIYDEKKIKCALKNIIKMNFREWQGLRNCQWPEDKFIHPIDKNIWVDQANTCWTGVELAFAALLLYENMFDEAMMIIKTLDDRYRKNGMYFDHQEFGGHYFRPMSSWSIINALLGLGYDDENLIFSPKIKSENFTLFFVAKGCYGIYTMKKKNIEIKILEGKLKAKKLAFFISGKIKHASVLVDGVKLENVNINSNCLSISFPKIRTLKRISLNFS